MGGATYAALVPAALLDVVAVGALLTLLAVAFAHPRGRVEASAGLLAAGAVLAVGAVSWEQARGQVDRMLPVVLFLGAILVVAELCAREGLFAAVGGLVRRGSRSDPRRLLTLTFVAAAAVTAVLSLDATVVLLTPVALAAVEGPRARGPVAHVCVRLANSGSLLLPVSNLTNLLALPALGLTFTGWAAVMAPVWLGVLVVEYVGVRLLFRSQLAPVTAPAPSTGSAGTTPLPRWPVIVVLVMLAGFVVGSPLGVEPFWVAGAAAALLAVPALRARRVTGREVLDAAHPTFLVFVLCLGVVVAALTGSFLGDLVGSLVPQGTGFVAALGIAALATVLANLVNNLPATLLLVPLVAPLGATAVLAALVGLNVGSGLTWTGSLANLLWRRTLVRRELVPSSLRFHVHAAAVTPVAVVVAVAILCR